MTKHPHLLLVCAALFSLTGCATQNSQIPALKTEVGQLNQKLQHLTDLALALEQQTTLNRQSDNGVYLLPAAKSAALLKSNIGELSLQLTRIAPTPAAYRPYWKSKIMPVSHCQRLRHL